MSGNIGGCNSGNLWINMKAKALTNVFNTTQETICGYLDKEPIYRRYVSGILPSNNGVLISLNAKQLIREDLFGQSKSGGGYLRLSGYATNTAWACVSLVNSNLYIFLGSYYYGGDYKGFIEYIKS